ncbi:proline-rich protein 2-like [Halichondria panicea]|uniref:proline-rich protein 2-like n=1 Tax=Halichondria panicea TaxID=6063 RepID=UPI00312B8274
MDPQTFNSLKSQLEQPFFSNKKSALESFLQNYWFSGEQTAEVIGNFPHASEKTEVLDLIEPRLTVLTGSDAKKVVAAFTFADGKLKAVGVVANHINDPVGKYTVLEAIDFHFDKEKAQKILDEARPPVVAQCPTGQSQPYGQPPPPHAHPYQPPAQPAPYQQPPHGVPYQQPPHGAPYSQPPQQQPYQPPPQQAQPYQPPPQSTPYSQAPGYPSQAPPYGAPPTAAPFAPPPTSQHPPPYGGPPAGGNPYHPTQGVPPPNAAYAPQGGAYPPQGGPPAGYPNTYGYPPQ